jgi:predicted lipoprotein with Yx(FWY)xxD motif
LAEVEDGAGVRFLPTTCAGKAGAVRGVFLLHPTEGISMSRRSLIHFLPTAAAVPLIALAIAGCGGGGGGGGSAATAAATPNGQAATVGMSDGGSLGQILVDSKGRTLYLFQADSATKSGCTGECATEWPPLRVSAKPVAGTGIASSKLGTLKRSDGAPQVTYNGHPLYWFTNDHEPGDASGQGLKDFGASWYVLSPDGTMVSRSASSSGSDSGSSSGGGGGY